MTEKNLHNKTRTPIKLLTWFLTTIELFYTAPAERKFT
jgi:hypothetical protein